MPQQINFEDAFKNLVMVVNSFRYHPDENAKMQGALQIMNSSLDEFRKKEEPEKEKEEEKKDAGTS